MNQDIHGPDVNERHERNKRAIAYLERLKARDEQHDAEKPGALTLILTWTGGIGIGFALWWAGHQLFNAFTSTL